MAAELNQKKTGHIVTLVLRQVKVRYQAAESGSEFGLRGDTGRGIDRLREPGQPVLSAL